MFMEESIPRLGTEENGMKKFSLTRNPAPANRMFSFETASEWNSESLLLFLFQRTEFRVVFSSAKSLGTEFQVFASILVLRNGIPRCFLYSGMVQNGILRVGFYFCPMVYRIPSIFLLCRTVWNGILRVFCSAEQPEFRRNKQIVPSISSPVE
jgi:hypothetical protein